VPPAATRDGKEQAMVRRPSLTGAEKESLQGFLDKQRDVMVWKLEGVGDADLRRPMTPSGTNLLGKAGVDIGRRFVDATSDLVACYKPNIAFFEPDLGAGIDLLRDLIAYIADGVPVLLEDECIPLEAVGP
jgi:hypothetical protein